MYDEAISPPCQLAIPYKPVEGTLLSSLQTLSHIHLKTSKMADRLAAAAEKYPSLRKVIKDDVEVSRPCTLSSSAVVLPLTFQSHDGREIALLKYIHALPNLDSLRDSPAAICAAMDEFAAQEDFLINLGHHKGAILADLILDKKPKVFVEFGGYVGYSAIVAGAAMRQYAGTEARVWSLELDPLCASIAMNFVDLAGLSDIVKVVVGTGEESLKRLQKEGKLTGLDMVMLDHVEDLYVSEFHGLESLGFLRKGVTVVADNVVRPGAPEYRKMVRSHPNLESHAVMGLITPGDFEVSCFSSLFERNALTNVVG